MYLLFDIGGTKMRAAVSEDGVSLGDVITVNTPAEFDDAVGFFTDFKGNGIEKVAGGLPGVLNKEKTLLVRAPNLPEWVGVHIRSKLEEIFGTYVFLENDAALAGLGEACYGAGKDKNIIGYLTISTGVGGARIVKRKIDISSWGFEPGNQIIDLDCSVWPDGKISLLNYLTKGSIESYVSGNALEKRCGKPAGEIKEKKVWNEVEKLLAVFLNNVITLWSPEIIILGGGLVLNNAVSVNNIDNNLHEIFKAFPETPQIRKSELFDNAGLFGAMALIKDAK